MVTTLGESSPKKVLEIIIDTCCSSDHAVYRNLDAAARHTKIREGIDEVRLTATYELMREITGRMHPALIEAHGTPWAKFCATSREVVPHIASTLVHDRFCAALDRAVANIQTWKENPPTPIKQAAQEWLNERQNHRGSHRFLEECYLKDSRTGAYAFERLMQDLVQRMQEVEYQLEKLGIEDPKLALREAAYQHPQMRILMNLQKDFARAKRDSGERSVGSYLRHHAEPHTPTIVITHDRGAKNNLTAYASEHPACHLAIGTTRDLQQACHDGLMTWYEEHKIVPIAEPFVERIAKQRRGSGDRFIG